VKLSNTQLLLVAGGVGLVGWYLMKRDPSSPFSLGGLFGTIMPNAPTQQQLAQHFAAQSGRGPVQAGTSGYGATSAQPAYAGLLPGLGSFVGSLFGKVAGPGNAAPASRPQASASSGGGVSQPTPGTGFTEIFDQSQVFFGEFDNSYGDFDGGGMNYAVSGGDYTIESDQGTYDPLTGAWY
jgi:hypothetical protein